MAYFPFLVDIEGKNIRIVGGGKVAARKVRIMAEYGAHLFVTAPAVEETIRLLASDIENQIVIDERDFAESDLDDMDFVIAATASEALNCEVGRLCGQRKIPVNVVYMEQECDFIFPAIIKEQDLLVAISTGGKSPLFAAWLKKELRRHIPAFYGKLVEGLGSCRENILQNVLQPAQRKRIFGELIERGISRGGELTDEDVRAVTEKNVRGNR